MSKENYTFDDLDDILAEFSGKKEIPAAESVVIPVAKPEPAAIAKEISKAPAVEETVIVPAIRDIPAAPHKADPKAHRPAPAKRPGSSFEEFEALFSREQLKKGAAQKQAAMTRKPGNADAPRALPGSSRAEAVRNARRESKPLDSMMRPAPVSKKEQREKARAEKARAKAQERENRTAQAEAARPAVEPIVPEPEEKKKFSAVHMLLSIVFAAVCIIVLAWTLFNVHPASGSAAATDVNGAVLRLSDKLDVYMNNVASDALGELAYIKKIYTLQESDTVAPVPNPDGFGRTRDVAVIQDVIKKASHLLEGQSVSFDPNADFVADTDFMYYLDDTIMVIAWKEWINERCCTMAEVKIAHGSQIRRKLAEDSYSSSVQYYASDMANAANAVIAINGDFYAFRDLGITVYQRQLYRNNPATVDTCFFTASGDMLFSRAGELMGEGEVQKFIEDNDVVFSVAFGPVLVDNGELQYCESYPIGEIDTQYSRSCIGMTDDLHYLLMTINHTPQGTPRANINELARYIYAKGVQKAYTLDGGQTAEIVMFGGPINNVDFGNERAVSDIIYFATAIPNEEVTG